MALTLFRLSPILLLVSCLCAFAADRAVPSPVPGWPQWRGPHRDGLSEETGLLPSWPEGGPRKLWTAAGIGRGFGSPIVVGDTIYIAGDVGEKFLVSAIDLDGKAKWRVPNGASWQRSQRGGRASACFADGRIYIMNAHGRLACLRAADGAEIWAVDVLERFGGRNIEWGVSESVLVDDGKVFVTPVGAKALMAALDAGTGATVWATPPLPGEQLSYSSAILVAPGGRRQVVTCGSQHVFGVDAGTGALLWRQPHAIPQWVVAMSPVFHGDSLFVTCATKDDGRICRLRLAGDRAERIWTADLGDTYCGNVVWIDGLLVGSRKDKFKEWQALDAETGAIRQVAGESAGGSVVHADGRLYCLTNRGTMLLRKLSEGGFETVGRLEVVAGKRDVWAHPVVCGGRLYVRYHDALHCYDVVR